LTKEEGLAIIQELIEKYNQIEQQGKFDKYNEADVGRVFILPLLKALGWHIDDVDEVKEQKQTLSGPVDYTLRLKNKDVLLVEIKDFDVKDGLDGHYVIRGKKETFPEQATRYGWHLKVEWVILTNFREIRLYNSYTKNPKDGLRIQLRTDKFIENFDQIWQLSKEEIQQGSLAQLEAKKERRDVDEEVVDDLLTMRYLLTQSLHQNNSELSNNELKQAVHTIMNRLLVIRVCEDRNIIGFETLYKEFETWEATGLSTNFIPRLNLLFRNFEEIYDTKLFEQHFSEELTIDNKILEDLIQRFYKYNFTMLSADVLGAIYENYLGHILEASKKEIEIKETKDVRKKGGIYYTPTYIVEYTVREALGKYLEKIENPDDVSKIKICDPSCGSGSFLIKAFDVMNEWYEEYNSKLIGSMDAHLKQVYGHEKKILVENIFGNDFDEQAAEIASINLFFKGVKKDEKNPQLLGSNITVGNSIISDDSDSKKFFKTENFVEKKPFDWKKHFPKIFAQGGFDVILGNPPHGADITKEERKYFEKNYETNKSYKNTASLFIEKCHDILKPNGIIALVIPKSLTFSEAWKPVREYVLKNFTILELIDVSKAFEKVLLEQIVLIIKKEKPLENYEVLGTNLISTGENTHYKIPIELFRKADAFLIHIDELSAQIFNKLHEFPKLGNYIDHYRGLPLQSKKTLEKTDFPALIGDDVKRYYLVEPINYLKNIDVDTDNEKVQSLLKPKIVTQRIVAHVANPIDHIIIMASFDEKGLLNFDTVENTFVKDSNILPEFVLSLLNSRFSSWYIYKFIFNKAIRTMDFDNYYISKVPIKLIEKEKQKIFVEKSKSLIKLIKDFLSLDVSFDKYFKLEPQTTSLLFHTLYREQLDSKDTETFDNTSIGKIKEIHADLDDKGWIIISAAFGDTQKELNVKKIFKFNLNNEVLSKFMIIWINSIKKGLGSGDIYKKILELEIPRYDKDIAINAKKIEPMLKPYLEATKQKKSLYEEISKINSEIDHEIYKIFNLTSDEIELIESETRPSVYLPRITS